MNISINIDCTPLEARSFLGLPDLTPVHDHYVQAMTDAVSKAGSVEQMQGLIQGFAPMGQAGLDLFRQMMEIGTGMGAGGQSPEPSSRG